MHIISFHSRALKGGLLLLTIGLYVVPFSVATMAQEHVSFPAPLKSCGTGRAAKVISGDRFRLESGKDIALAEVKVPEYWPPGAPYKSWPFGHQAKAALTRALKDTDLELFCTKRAKSAHGDLLAHVRTGNNEWVQQAMVKAGFAYFMPHGQAPRMASELRAAEREARTERRGLWSHEGLRIKRADGEGLQPGWFQLIGGKIVSEAKRKNRMYLNFGEDWSRDFTIEIPKRLYRYLPKITGEQDTFLGKTVEVRGWVEWAGGPKIILEFAEQLIVVPEPGR